MKGSYFDLEEWSAIVLLALGGTLFNLYLPFKAMAEGLDLPGPAAGTAIFGGLMFVVWISLGRKFTKKRCGGITVAVLLASFSILLRPWYGIISPSFFSIYGIVALFVLGLWIEVFRGRLELIGGGLGNLSCLGITWLAFGIHLDRWPPSEYVPLLLSSSFLSGIAGVLLARFIEKFFRRMFITK